MTERYWRRRRLRVLIQHRDFPLYFCDTLTDAGYNLDRMI